jgi:hypothetical protein
LDTVFLSSAEQEMHFLIVPMRERGVARSKRDIASAEPVKGDIIFSSAPRVDGVLYAQSWYCREAYLCIGRQDAGGGGNAESFVTVTK